MLAYGMGIGRIVLAVDLAFCLRDVNSDPNNLLHFACNVARLSGRGNQVFLLDLQFHDVKRTRGLYYLMESRGLIERVVEEEAVQRAMSTPPQTTRAKVRISERFIVVPERSGGSRELLRLA